MPNSLYSDSLRPALSQGDILENVRIAEPHLGTGERTFSVMVLSHACEIDKPNNKVLIVASVRPLRDFNPGDHDRIRAGKVLSLYYLPSDPPSLPVESCVDLRQIFRVSFEAIKATAFIQVNGETQRTFVESDPRRLSLSDDGIAALYGRLAAFFTRSRSFEAATTAPTDPASDHGDQEPSAAG